MNAIVRPPQSVDDPTRVARLLWLRTVFGEVIKREESFSVEPLAARMTEFFLPRGGALYQSGSVSDSLFFIVSGAVRQEGEGYTLFRAGDVLGFVDAMSDRPHLHTAAAEEDSIILRLKLDDWLNFLEEHPPAIRGLLGSGNDNSRPRPDLWGRNADVLDALLAPVSPQPGSSQFVRRLLAARCSPLLRRASIQALAQLVHPARVVTLEAGEHYALSETGLWLVVAGSVWAKIGSEEDHESHDYPPGTILGATRLLIELPEILRVQAATASEILFISSEHYFEVMEDHFDLARSSMIYMARKLEESNRERGDEAPPPAPTR